MKYDPKEIEKKWQKIWEEKGIYKTKEQKEKPKYYVLDMFPYPSGAGLHVGHPKGYIATDVIARMKMMQGFNVLHPMGWDAFGLPAENYAIKNKVHPKVSVDENIATFKRQLEQIGFTYDWDREINTTDPKYYKWTQWIFLQMFKKGLAFQSYEPINWCPSCQTGLANEDLEDGKCERCGSEVEQRPMRQWVLKITAYADRLLNDLEKLPDWPDAIKEMQKNWIGRSEGALIKFEVIVENDVNDKVDENDKNDQARRSNKRSDSSSSSLEVFTTRADTIFGASYAVVAPEHPLIDKMKNKIRNYSEIEKYREEAKKKTELERAELQKDKTGVEIKGVKAANPATGEEIPIWVADYVLGSYGTGAVMAVPAHDERDFEFAKKYNLPIKQVVSMVSVDQNNPPREGKKEIYRKIAHVVVRNKKGQTMLLRWKGDAWKETGRYPVTFLVGGIEEGEDTVEAARREVLEEAGYTNLKHVETLPMSVRVHFFAAHKDVNRVGDVHCVVFELDSEDKAPVDPQELNKHDCVFVDDEKVASELNIPDDVYFWEQIQKQTAYTEEGILVNSGEFSEMKSDEARVKIVEWLGKKSLAEKKVNYKIRDWVFSRQRYWGEPIPIIHCEKCGVVPVPEKDLPVELPNVKNYEPSGTGESPLANIEEWVNTSCPSCGGPAKRETNTMPQWAGSSWYYLRYIDPKNDETLVDKVKEKYWSPVDFYVGGAEHATRHLIYARFWHKFLFDIEAVNYEEPFTRLQNVGLILAEDGRKMSKRWGNVINPDDVVEQYGADSLRLYEMFMGPFAQAIAWNTNGLVGARRFLDRVWSLQERISKDAALDKKLTTMLHQTIEKVGADIAEMRFNTAVAKMMEMVNEFYKAEKISTAGFETFIKLLAPFSPHIAEELWAAMGNNESIFVSNWPEFDRALTKAEKMTLAVQINGKVRDELEIDTDSAEEAVKSLALQSEKVQKWLEGKEPKKVIYVKGKLVSIVV